MYRAVGAMVLNNRAVPRYSVLVAQVGPRRAYAVAAALESGGMLEALYERDVAPDLIVGSSVGALNGAFIPSRPAIPETALKLAA